MSETLPERDIPAPKYVIVNKSADIKRENGDRLQEWLVKLENPIVIRLLPGIEDDKMKPERFGETDHVMVATVTKAVHSGKVLNQTTVYASDENGTFYNAPIYVSPGVLDMWQVMFALGEI